MQVPIKRGSAKAIVDCEFAVEIDKETVESWTKELTEEDEIELEVEQLQRMRDCLEYLECTQIKLQHCAERNRVQLSSETLKASIRQEANGEFVGLILATAEWNAPCSTLGFCFFRRTWCNHIAVDFLATHPCLQRSESEILGVGTALLYAIGEVAQEIFAPTIWAETTDLSVKYYQKLFKIPTLKDILILDTKRFRTYLSDKINQQK